MSSTKLDKNHKKDRESEETKSLLGKSETSVKTEVKVDPNDDSQYFMLSKIDKLIVLIGGGCWSYWLIKFGLKTVE